MVCKSTKPNQSENKTCRWKKFKIEAIEDYMLIRKNHVPVIQAGFYA